MAPLTLRLLLSLTAGLAAGVHTAPLAPDSPLPAVVQVAFAVSLMLAALAHANRWLRVRHLTAWVSVAVVAGMLGSDSAERALHPSLRVVLDDGSRAGVGGGSSSTAAGMSARPGVRPDPVVAEGVLRQDATLGATGVVLRLSIDRVWLSESGVLSPVPVRKGMTRAPRSPRWHAWRFARLSKKRRGKVDSETDPGSVSVDGGASVVVAGELAPGLRHEWTEGRRVRAPMTLRRPAVYLNEGVPDFERALALRDVTLVGTIKSGALVEVMAPGLAWQEWGARTRARVRRALASYLTPGAAAVAVAILIGDRAALAADVERRLQEAGTYHVLAISGGNIAILAGAVIGTLALAGWRGRGAALAAMLLLAAYAVIVEGGPSVARATSMALLYLAIRLIDQRTAAVNALALVVIGILLADPLAVVDVGLWLTAGATLGIILAAERARALWWSTDPTSLASRQVLDSAAHAVTPIAPARQVSPDRVGRDRRHVFRSAVRVVAALLMATMAAEIVLMPVSALVFQRVTLAGLALNFLAIPCMTVVQLGAMAVVALDALGMPSMATIAAVPTEWAVAGLVDSASFVDYAPWLTWRVPPPSIWVLSLYYASLAAWWLAASATTSGVSVQAWRPSSLASGVGVRERPTGLAGGVVLFPIDMPHERIVVRASAASAAVLFVWIAADPPSLARSLGDGRLHVTTIDVGQGDCLLITFPNGRHLLVDAGGVTVGGDFDVGDRVVGPALRARGVRRLDYVAITHGDPDHIGGARAVVRDFAPREIWYGVPVANHALTMKLRTEADLARTAWRTLQRGDRLDIGGVELHVLHPPPPDWERQRVRNGDSLVFDLRLGEVSVVLTGDIGRDVEQTLGAAIPPAPLRVVKVPHHGSATSSSATFIDALSPTVATIGVGRGNPYGHPTPQVLARYREAGADVFRTDEDGQIDVITDGRRVEVRTFTGRLRGHEDTKGTKTTPRRTRHATKDTKGQLVRRETGYGTPPTLRLAGSDRTSGSEHHWLRD